MGITHENDWNDSEFIIECIEKCEPPKGMTGNDWYLYIVRQNNKKITGFKTGTLERVTEDVERFRVGLNERTVGNSSTNTTITYGKNQWSPNMRS